MDVNNPGKRYGRIPHIVSQSRFIKQMEDHLLDEHLLDEGLVPKRRIVPKIKVDFYCKETVCRILLYHKRRIKTSSLTVVKFSYICRYPFYFCPNDLNDV